MRARAYATLDKHRFRVCYHGPRYIFMVTLHMHTYTMRVSQCPLHFDARPCSQYKYLRMGAIVHAMRVHLRHVLSKPATLLGM